MILYIGAFQYIASNILPLPRRTKAEAPEISRCITPWLKNDSKKSLLLQSYNRRNHIQGLTFTQRKKPQTPMSAGFFQTPRVGLEPTTTRLTAECSTIELSRIIRHMPSKSHTVQKDTHFSHILKTSVPEILLVKPSTD